MFSNFCERLRRAVGNDDGSAAVEFVTVGVILTVPLLYLVIALAQLQAGFMAVEAGARNAARVVALYGQDAFGTAEVGTALALQDAGLGSADHTIAIACAGDDCDAPEGTVTVTVEAQVPLPLIPQLGTDAIGLPVTATAVMPISAYADQT